MCCIRAQSCDSAESATAAVSPSLTHRRRRFPEMEKSLSVDFHRQHKHILHLCVADERTQPRLMTPSSDAEDIGWERMWTCCGAAVHLYAPTRSGSSSFSWEFESKTRCLAQDHLLFLRNPHALTLDRNTSPRRSA